MSALLESLGIDAEALAHLNPDQVEADVESGGVIPEGKYHVMLIGAGKREAKESGNSGTELEFQLLAGPHKDTTVKDTVWKSDKAKGQNRGLLFAHRLGLLHSTTDGEGKKHYTPVEGKSDWCDIIGTQCVIDVIIEEYEMTDKTTKKPNGKKGKANRLAFQGVYTLNDPKVKDVLRATGTIATPAAGHSNGSSSSNGVHKPKDDYASLGI